MATASIILLKTKKLKDGKHPIVLRVTNNRIRKYYFLGKKEKNHKKNFSASLDLWDEGKNRFINEKEYKFINQILNQKETEARNILIKIELEKKYFSFEAFNKEFINKIKNNLVYTFFDEEIERLKKSNKHGYSNVFKFTRNSIFNFHKSKELHFTDINYSFLKKYTSYLQSQNTKPNSINVYLRTLRTLYNNAIKEGVCQEETYPFKSRTNPNGFTLADFKQETPKRAITKEQMCLIRDFPVTENTGLFHSKNYFMFSFYTMGMNFIDLSYLKWSNIKNGRIEYYRAKTGRSFSIKINSEIKKILDYYRKNGTSEYIFPILKEQHITTEQQYRRSKNMLKKILKHLKQIAEQLKFDFNLTTYVSRHSWATIMRDAGYSNAITGSGLGHQTEQQTTTYLKPMGNKILDDANKKLL